MTSTALQRALVEKSKRALKSARLALSDKDYDNAVNRSCYSMFDIARAALLRTGVDEGRLPRTHSGVNEAFYRHAVQSGQIDRELAGDLSRTESHRIKADHTGVQIDLETATEAVGKAEVFVQTVERVFGLDEASLAAEYETRNEKPDDKVSEPAAGSGNEINAVPLQPVSLEEERRQARENWLRLRAQRIKGASAQPTATRESGKEFPSDDRDLAE